MNAKVGRNDPCPCGSGKKYKQCCMKKNQPAGRRRFKATVLSAKGTTEKSEADKTETNAVLQSGPDLIARTYAKKENNNEELESESSTSSSLDENSP